jgi:hypothetical protein
MKPNLNILPPSILPLLNTIHDHIPLNTILSLPIPIPFFPTHFHTLCTISPHKMTMKPNLNLFPPSILPLLNTIHDNIYQNTILSLPIPIPSFPSYSHTFGTISPHKMSMKPNLIIFPPSILPLINTSHNDIHQNTILSLPIPIASFSYHSHTLCTISPHKMTMKPNLTLFPPSILPLINNLHDYIHQNTILSLPIPIPSFPLHSQTLCTMSLPNRNYLKILEQFEQ